MKRIAAISLLVFTLCLWLSSFPAQALPEGVVVRLGIENVYAVAFSPDGATLAGPTYIGVYLLNHTTLEQTAAFETDKTMDSVAFSPDGKLLASGRGKSE